MTTWLSRNHRTLSEEWLEPRNRDGVFPVANRQAKVCVGSVNHPVWAIIHGPEGWTIPVTADKHCTPPPRVQVEGARIQREETIHGPKAAE